MTAVASDVVSVITHHHAELAEALTGRVDALVTAARLGAPYDEPTGGLRELLAHDIVPHARAEEDVLYAAATEAPLRPLVAGMVFEHETLLALAGRLNAATSAVDAAATAFAIQAVFLGHVRRENELLLPALAADPLVDLPDLLPQMERRFVEYRSA
ncbi:MAG TPA: hemerythrin domain-containing protein [Mycobacteriales bacterium]|nr:hemerythrin domain-containing protein [Mycobacteriales bacterium]